ncbi:MAG: hypothetical protein HYZ49_08605 [Chloroflexi bacterium]|nr:hypothetical protein [Chloroflexota bacterium]
MKLFLSLTEYDALGKLAALELRGPADEVRHILRQELERRGLLPADSKAKQAEGEPAEAANVQAA